MSEVKKCELCKEKDITALCSECHKCYCDGCSEFIHKKTNFKDHKVEAISEGIIVSATCPLHENNLLELFCVDEVKLCCILCKEEKLHEGHNLVEISEIQRGNENFPAQKAMKLFEDSREQVNELDKKTESVIEEVENEVSDIQERVKKTFEEEHKKLEGEEKKAMYELEEEKSRSEASLEKYLKKLREISEYNDVLNEFDDKTKGKLSIMMELNILSEMEKQRKELELLCEEEMYDLHFMWDDKKRNLSYMKKLFNGIPVPSNITFPNVLCRKVEITWKCDVNKVHEEDRGKISYVVEMKKNCMEEWKEVYSGKEMKCAVNNLEMGTEYIVRVRYMVDGLMGKWSENRNVKTKEIYPPKNVALRSLAWDSIEVSWEEVDDISCYRVIMIEEDKDFAEIYRGKETKFIKRGLLPNTEYSFRVCSVKGNEVSECSDIMKRRIMSASEFSECVWKECPDNVNERRRYFVDKNIFKIATKTSIGEGNCTIVGNIPVPPNKVTSWSIKLIKSKYNDGKGIFIGVAPFDINQNSDKKCGWYFNCYRSTLYSGPPHDYILKKYGPRKEEGEYVHTGDIVSVVMDTTANSELSFIVNWVNLGVAYEGIPLDKPLVPCVNLYCGGDSVELDTTQVKETKMDFSFPIPSNIVSRSDSWDSITLTWDAVDGAGFYQIEVDGGKILSTITINSFTKRGLLSDTEHSFRVRAMKTNFVSEWSDVVKRRTMKTLDFSECVWKECPDYVDERRRYSVDKNNFRIATKTSIGEDSCAIIGNIPISPNKVTSWSIKVLLSKYNCGGGIYIGVAPFDINQNNFNENKCGWNFDCYNSILFCGPPHNYICKKYGPNKGVREYVHTGDIVGVMIDTTKGDLSFVLSGVNLGVAFEGIPLDKPLVPCVLLREQGDIVELDLSEIKENTNTSIFVPSNVTAKSESWDSITLTWDAIGRAEFYQIEMDGSKLCNVIKANSFTKSGFLPESEHSFRVCTVKMNSVSEWSYVAKGRTQKQLFETSAWKESPDNVGFGKGYSIDETNPRIASKINETFHGWSTIIGNTFIPSNKVTFWGIKILESKDNDGASIYVGVAPFDINQKEEDNYKKCGWYFDCYGLLLLSGPPHNYKGKEYGPKEKRLEDVHIGDIVGVVMDTIKSELSFVLDGVNLGIAYEGIPLDKPLVPCVLLGNNGNSVELIADGELKGNLDKSCVIS